MNRGELILDQHFWNTGRSVGLKVSSEVIVSRGQVEFKGGSRGGAVPACPIPIGGAERLQLLSSLSVDVEQRGVLLRQDTELILQTGHFHGNKLVPRQLCQQLTLAVLEQRYLVFDLVELLGHPTVVPVNLD